LGCRDCAGDPLANDDWRHATDSRRTRGGASAHREGEGRRLEHQSARRAVVCIGLRCLGQRLARPTIRTCRRQLAHGRWASDRVSRSAREAGASLQMNETRQLQVAAARKAAVSAFWQEHRRGVHLPQSRTRSSLPESRRGAILYCASWPRGHPPERGSPRRGASMPPSDPVEPGAATGRLLSPPPRRRRRPARRRHRRLSRPGARVLGWRVKTLRPTLQRDSRL